MERLPFDVAGIVASFLVPVTELRSESLVEDAEDPFENVSGRRTVASDEERDLPAERWAGADAEVLGSLAVGRRGLQAEVRVDSHYHRPAAIGHGFPP